MNMVDCECLDLIPVNVVSISFRVETSIPNHLRDFVLALEKHKAMQIFSM
jgi:hypothetical protein